MIFFHGDHAPNVAEDPFAEPPAERDGIAELGGTSLAACSTTTTAAAAAAAATGALVPKQCKHLQPEHSGRLQQRSELSSTYPALSEEVSGIISHNIT
jgi:hypothetical protein